MEDFWRIERREHGPGGRADDLAVEFGDKEPVDVQLDVAQGAGHQLVRVGLDALENGLAVAEAGLADLDGIGGHAGIPSIFSTRNYTPVRSEGNARKRGWGGR
jgi:hypothetical protein